VAQGALIVISRLAVTKSRQTEVRFFNVTSFHLLENWIQKLEQHVRGFQKKRLRSVSEFFHRETKIGSGRNFDKRT
jgi:hypothetical protein